MFLEVLSILAFMLQFTYLKPIIIIIVVIITIILL